MYPNPANNELIVDFGALLDDFMIRISDNRGALIYINTYEDLRKLNIDISDFAPGAYLLEIIMDEEKIARTFFKL